MVSTSAIKQALIDKGAAAVGIAPAVKLPEVCEIIHRQNQDGLLAEMHWLETTSRKRTDPALHIKGAGSIICTVWPYRTASDSRHIARFAQHEDYHRFIADKLREARNQAVGDDGTARFFVDSGPIAEKPYAALAGLGWIGKNTLLIHSGLGSFFCLGTIVTDIELEYDSPTENRCGTCTKCIERCPTGALTPYTLDCRRCISYLTIEHKGDIPEKLRPLIGSHVYGCDICQEACPYNDEDAPKAVMPAKSFDIEPICRLLLLDDVGFKNWFKGTVIERLGRDRFLRNVAVVIGNTKDKKAVSFLSECLQERDSLIRRHIKWALKQIVRKISPPLRGGVGGG